MDFEIITPKTKSELLKAMRQNRRYRFGAGYTDLILELKKHNAENIIIINLAQLQDQYFKSIKKKPKYLFVGALVTAFQILHDKFIAQNFSLLQQAANNLASSQIRQVATVGGNLCTASPSGDIACALVALGAKCEVLSSKGETRTLPIQDFFTGPRKTALIKDEVLRNILIPVNQADMGIHSKFIKVGTRRSMECSVISMAYHFQTDKKGIIKIAGIAIGSVAPTIRFAEEACKFLIGKNIYELTSNECELFAQTVLQYASPISDIRATAWYRKEVLFNISKSIFENQ